MKNYPIGERPPPDTEPPTERPVIELETTEDKRLDEIIKLLKSIDYNLSMFHRKYIQGR